MPNALTGSIEPGPPPPLPQQGNALQGSAPQQPQQAPPSPPTHDQTVAALRHFDAIKSELEVLLKNPDLGKSDVKSHVIDGVSKLVGSRIISPPNAVNQLSQFPADPQAQRKWLQNMMTQTQQAERSILAHHAVGFAGQGPQPTPSADSHMDVMAGLNSQFGGGK